MNKKSRRVVAGAAMAAALTIGGPVNADVAVFDDAGDVSSSVDIQRVRVDNGETDPGRIRVRVVQDDLLIGDEVTVYLDLRPRDPGPEWKVTGRPAAEWALLRVERWHGRVRDVPCGAGSMRIDEVRDVTRLVLPFSCLEVSPRRVRVAVKVTRDDPVAADWAPAFRTFLPWVPVSVPDR
ncbi:MAG TPA: hypothetical protein VFK52_00940 [Nocardioidaceae bacterium]|nr:hypothetical protein [Nocardioidaceae bacterium]